METAVGDMDFNKNTMVSNIESAKLDFVCIPSTSRYGRARKPKSYFNDYYNTEGVLKNQKSKTNKPTSPKTSPLNSKKRGRFKDSSSEISQMFVHVTGDQDVNYELKEPLNPMMFVPIAETTEDNFENFVKSVSGQVEELKPVESSVKERKFFKTANESKLQASTISYISKVAPRSTKANVSDGVTELCVLPSEPIELVEPVVDVNKVIKIVTAKSEVESLDANAKLPQKCTLKTYGNKRKKVQSDDVFESFALPDKPFIDPKESVNLETSAILSDIDIIIDTADKNQIQEPFSKELLPNKNANTFFGVKLSPEKVEQSKDPAVPYIQQNSPVKNANPTVTKFCKLQSTGSIDTKNPFIPLTKQNTVNVVPIASTSGSKMTVIPTCKIKSITAVVDVKSVSPNRSDKKFVTVVMDKSEVLKVPAAGGSPTKIAEETKTGYDVTTILCPQKSELTIKKAVIPIVTTVPRSTNDSMSTIDTKLIIPSSPVTKVPASVPKILTARAKVIPAKAMDIHYRKRKQDLIQRKDMDHSYSIMMPHALSRVAPKKRFMHKLNRNREKVHPVEDSRGVRLQNLKAVEKSTTESSKKITGAHTISKDFTVLTKVKQPLNEIPAAKDNLNKIYPLHSKETVKDLTESNVIKSDMLSGEISLANSSLLPASEVTVHNKEHKTELQKISFETAASLTLRVSPRKGKGMNASLWENNSGAFFIKQSTKGKVAEVVLHDENERKDTVELNDEFRTDIEEDAANKESSISLSAISENVMELLESNLHSDIPLIDHAKDAVVENSASSPFKEKNHKKVDAAITEEILRKIKESGPIKDKSIVSSKPKRHFKLHKTLKRKTGKRFDPNIAEKRQLRTRKFIFAEQITRTSSAIPLVKVIAPKSSNEVDDDKVVKRNIKVVKPDTDPMNSLVLIATASTDDVPLNQLFKLKTDDKIDNNKLKKMSNAVKNVEVPDQHIDNGNLSKSKMCTRNRKGSETEDVILVNTHKKVIVINSDDEGDSPKNLKPHIESEIIYEKQIKIEKVTPEKRPVASKKKRRIRQPKILSVSKKKRETRSSVNKFPMPICESPVEPDIPVEIKKEITEDQHDLVVHTKSSANIGIVKQEKDLYSEGDMVWAKVGCYPYWPAMIVRDPSKNIVAQPMSKSKNMYYHVRYFADNGRRSWVRLSSLIQYKARDDLEVLQKKIKKKRSAAATKYKVPKTKLTLWNLAVDELESIKNSTHADKLHFFEEAASTNTVNRLYKAGSPRTRGIKREKPGDDAEALSPRTFKTLSSTRRIPITMPEVKTPTSVQSMHVNKSLESPRAIDRFLRTQLDGKMMLRSCTEDDMQLIQKEGSKEPETDCSSSDTDSINKLPLFGPIPCTMEYQEALHKRNNLFKKVTREKICEICYKPNNVIPCKGPCCGFYHLLCCKGRFDKDNLQSVETIGKINRAGNSKLKTSRNTSKKYVGTSASSSNSSDTDSKKSSKKVQKADNFICGNCDQNLENKCFVCTKLVSTQGDSVLTRCNQTKCGKYYHRECTRLWPQAQWSAPSTTATTADKPLDSDVAAASANPSTSIVCPRHTCHICVSDDPKAASAHACRTETLVRCLLCPAAYHAATDCVPAGTEILTHSQIICPRHITIPTGIAMASSLITLEYNVDYYTKPVPPINTTWCFICSSGGDLICCETCPISVHEACSPINWLTDGSYVCEDCETGRLTLYDEVVWVKLGSYRWWPALVLYPRDVPPNIRQLRHRRGEFVIKFFGSYDHHWMGRNRVFLYQEGDKGGGSATVRKRMDVAFAKALDEAAAAYALKKGFRANLQANVCPSRSLKPPHYTKIRVNKPIGNVKVFDNNTSITTPCECDPKSNTPCGPDSHCLNRILWTECNPKNCPAGGRCHNQLFEKRQYPPLVPYKTEGRGWGLRTLAPIAAAQFVIEYVGEMIEEQEYKRRVARMQTLSEQNYYFLTIDADRIIDAGPKGNSARFMNHSCEPNCETQKWTINGDTRVGLFACQDIPANSELTFNYNLESNGKRLLECKCNASTCSGFIGIKKTVDPSKLKGTKEKVKKKKKRKAKNRTLKMRRLDLAKTCFKCGKGGHMITCSNITCRESFHMECVKLQNAPTATWRCHRHYCNVCRRKVIKRCKKCTNSYCTQHCDIKLEGKIIEFICADHKGTIRSEIASDSTKSVESINKKPRNQETRTKKLPGVTKKTFKVRKNVIETKRKLRSLKRSLSSTLKKRKNK